MIPEHFIGAWKRVTLSLCGGPEYEPEDVYWLQGPQSFVDLRVNRMTGAVAGCAAGFTTWTEPHLRWERTIDLCEPAPPEDVGLIAWDGADILESGVFPFADSDGPVPYVERWRRLAADRPVRCWHTHRGMLIQAGEHSLGVLRVGEELVGCYRSREPDGDSGHWVATCTAGRGDELIPLPEAAEAGGWERADSDGAGDRAADGVEEQPV